MGSNRSKLVREVAVPIGSLAASAFPVTSFADAYAIELPAGGAQDVDALTRLLATSAPRWAEHLMWARDRIVSPIGLRTSRPRAVSVPGSSRIQPGDLVGMFRVIARSDDEILMGADDSHLNFRVSMVVQRGESRSQAVLSTVVHFNNNLGRAYFFVVRPFHQLIVTALLRNMKRRLSIPQIAHDVR